MMPWRNLSDVHHKKIDKVMNSLQRYYFNISKNDINRCAFIFEFMKCKSAIKNALHWLINEHKILLPRNMSSHNLSRYIIKNNL